MPSSKSAADRKASCTPRPSAKEGDVRLSVIAVDPVTGMKKSRSGRWRAYSLAIVHLLMVGHFLHWLWAGSTLTPIEPSESVELIRRGEINMGLVFFGLALIATLILGRWVCGWGCHIIAYQDLTLWLLKKLRMRPKAFRTRFMIYIPLVVAAGWMFLYPLGARLWTMVQGHPAPEFTWHLMRTGFWDTFPGPVFACLTILVCGVVIIYYLGPKAFCTYGCPYGAFFGLTDKLATARIRVTDACKQCGHCTAACTSNVNVAEEVNLYKMVVDPGCMKCLDCVEVCPNDALYFGFGKPALGAKPARPPKQRRYDMTLAEEIVALFVFFATLVSVNGLYGQFPFLMSLGVACVVTFVCMKTARIFYARDVMLQKLRLKTGGKTRPQGVAHVVVTLLLVGLLIHSGVWRYHDILGGWVYDESIPNWQYDSAFVENASPEKLEKVAAGVHHYEACERWGLFGMADNHLRLGWLYLFTDDPGRAPGQMHKALAAYPDRADWWLQLAKVETHLGHLDKAREAFEKAISLETATREALFRKAGPVRLPISARIWVEWAGFHAAQGDFDSARPKLLNAVRFDPQDQLAIQRLNLLRSLEPQDFTQAVSDYREAIRDQPGLLVLRHNLAHALTISRRYDEAVEQYREALKIAPDSLLLRFDFGAVLIIRQDFEGLAREYEFILKAQSRDPEIIKLKAETALRLAVLYAGSGSVPDALRVLSIAIKTGSKEQQQRAKQMWQQLSRQPPPA
ncbi:MAG: tetratricopeptide repeat protein [Phycisphaerales bacterium]|nr:tetratricopeptide repeat protein [Phycisphaerales bacterium]